MTTLAIVGQNQPDATSDQLVAMHDRTFIFEPLPECAAALRKRYGQHAVVEAACGAHFGCMDFHVYNQSGLSSSLGTIKDAANLYSSVDLSLQKTISVSVVNLWSFLWQRDIHELAALVIDAQGNDLTILKTMEPMIASGSIGFIQCEADGPGAELYDLPNSEADFVSYMAQFPRYEMGKVPNRVAFNPDLYWELQ